MLLNWMNAPDPLAELAVLRRHLDRVFDDYLGGPAARPARAAALHGPPVNLVDAGDALTLQAELPGMDEDALELNLTASVLTISGKREVDTPEGYSTHRSERAPFSFSRSFSLPVKIDPEKTTAKLERGVLTVTMPKAPESRPRSIAVKSA